MTVDGSSPAGTSPRSLSTAASTPGTPPPAKPSSRLGTPSTSALPPTSSTSASWSHNMIVSHQHIAYPNCLSYKVLQAQLMRQDVEQCKTFSCKRDRHLSGSRRFSSLPALADRRVVSCSKVDSLWQLVMFLDGEQHCISNLFLTVGVIFGMQPKLYLC
ncbi:uncharacterized protein LOC120105484 isoform X1 [Phoenix dactylifera]|uniref:Uncharacterized protein LOC120105484 isoform X1 n=1 Tax=Phoenix dactylifera TaxID=42345 RepID=A0A8B8ZID7_PHODC|nr:uncharacterized protein LOC120105484 isoform X1 [Phoenix dactylifera]XP_038973935.1 uncharacterized protein LOC120105484 isoform X1 [Phoenix dactylifera]